MININIFAGPGTGKSTTAHGLMYRMKMDGHKVEFVPEYAKELTYGKDSIKLSDQILLLGQQHHRVFRLKDELDYVIHDSPFVMGMVYAQEEFVPLPEFEALILAMYKRYNHMNFFIERDNDHHKYQEYGRNQNLEEAQEKDTQIKEWLTEKDIPFFTVKMGQETVQEILNIVGQVHV